jgi:hypothetical protein
MGDRRTVVAKAALPPLARRSPAGTLWDRRVGRFETPRSGQVCRSSYPCVAGSQRRCAKSTPGSGGMGHRSSPLRRPRSCVKKSEVHPKATRWVTRQAEGDDHSPVAEPTCGGARHLLSLTETSDDHCGQRGWLPPERFGMDDRWVGHTPDTSQVAASLSPLRLRGRQTVRCRPTPQWPTDIADLPAAPKGAAPCPEAESDGSARSSPER